MNSADITGVTSGRLTAVRESHKDGRYWSWECACSCGGTAHFPNKYIKDGNVSNCGKCASSTRANAVYLGETSVSTEGYIGEVVGFISTSPSIFQVRIKGSPDAILEVRSGNFKMGAYSNPYHPSVAGVGYFGQGKFIAKSGGEHTVEYADWNSMLKRCYKSAESTTSYKDKVVCDSWHNFQNFAEWATSQENFGKVGWDLEKDLLVKGNKVYSPETCVYLPREINSFIKRKRHNNLPLGVDVAYRYDGSSYYRTQAREDGKNICLGAFSNPEAAFLAYKTHKEGLAKELANKWKGEIPERAYKALYNYQVEITD